MEIPEDMADGHERHPGILRALFFHGASLLFGLIILVLILEITFRATGYFKPPVLVPSRIPGMVFESRPGTTYWVNGNRVDINKAGFHDVEYTEKKADGVFRVVCLGDSMTMSQSLPIDKNYTSLLEDMLSRGAPHRRVEFLNMAVGGYNTRQEWLTYQNKAARYKPDLILTQFSLNDFTDTYPLDISKGMTSRLKHFLDEHSRTYRFLKFMKIRLTSGMNMNQGDFEKMNPEAAPISPVFMEKFYKKDSPFFREWKKSADRFGALNRDQTPVLFVIFPWPIYQGMSKNAPYPYYRFHEQIKSELKKRGLPYIDVTPRLTARDNLRRFWVTPNDFHLDARAHAIIAKALEPEVKKIIMKSRK